MSGRHAVDDTSRSAIPKSIRRLMITALVLAPLLAVLFWADPESRQPKRVIDCSVTGVEVRKFSGWIGEGPLKTNAVKLQESHRGAKSTRLIASNFVVSKRAVMSTAC